MRISKTTAVIIVAIATTLLTLCCLLSTSGQRKAAFVRPERLDNPDIAKMEGHKKGYEQQLAEIDYYMRSHSVMDEGFDIVTRRRERLTALIDSLEVLMDATARFESELPFFVFKQSEFVYYDERRYKDTVRIADGSIMRIHYPDNTYYEGEYTDTIYEGAKESRRIRHGFGVAFTHEGVRAGLWKNDKYQGEQPLYTAHHIYGIDISRYQHEQAGVVSKKGRWQTVKQKVKVKGRWRTVTKKVRVRKPVSYPIDWSRLRITSLGTKSKKKINGVVDYPISFVYIKSTEGVSITNKYYLGDYVQSRKHGYKTGSYHFFSLKSSAASQAMYFIRNSRYQKGDMPPVLDVEPTPTQVAQMGGARLMLKSVRQWLETTERYLNVRPILYVGQNFVNRYLNSKYDDGAYIKDNYHIWIARYGEYKPDVHLIFWQLCYDGRVSGIVFPVDINIFNGYADSFNEFTK